MTKRSLLWKTAESPSGSGRGLLRDLLLEDTLKSALGSENKGVEYFLKVLSEPPVQSENIRYRAEILRDFRAYPLFFDRLLASVTAFDALPQQFQLEKGSISVHTAAKFGSDAKYRTSLAILIMTANMLETTFSHLADLLALIEHQDLTSEAFCTIGKRLHTLLEHPSYQRLTEILKRVAGTPEDYLIELQFTLSEFGKIARYDVQSISSLEFKIHKDKARFNLLHPSGRRGPKIQLNVPASIPIADPDNTLRNQLLGGIYNKMSEVLSRLLQSLIDEFGGLSHELQFYRIAMLLYKSFDRYGISYCEAQITQTDGTEIEELSDLVLLLASFGQKKVTANDAKFSARAGGILIRGENNSGKTVYLRSVATALIFAQNGLPVLAKRARIHPQSSIRILFASAEKTQTVGAGVGRFEEEVQALAALVDQAKAGDLIFLNEIFQTTAYTEGAKGLREILQYLNAIGASWICVTHLNDLFERFRPDGVTMLQTTDPGGETPYRLMEIEK